MSDRRYARVMDATGADPLPYGIAPNRGVLDELLEAALSQQILRDRMPLETLFATATLDLTA
jgi:4,5-dihydroxyphthalate decarboxylase